MKPQHTRFEELGYTKIDTNLWRIVSLEDGAVIGPQYRTKTELLCDLERYATEYGCFMRTAFLRDSRGMREKV